MKIFRIIKEVARIILAKLSLYQALVKARCHASKSDVVEAEKLSQCVSQTFSKNKKAQQGLDVLNKLKQNNVTQSPSQEAIDHLVNLYNQGQFSSVVEQAQALTEEYPNTFIVWNILGASMAQMEMIDDAIEAYNKSISLKPDYAEAYNNMGNALKDQSKLDEAIKVYKKALSLKPDYADAYSNMGATLQDQGKLDEAIEAYNKCISIRPDYADAYYNMGVALKDQGKLEEAITAYNKALLLKPDYAEAYSNMGNALKDQDKFDQAIVAYNKALSIKPDYAEAYGNMGITFQEQGKHEQAIEACYKSISLKPDDAVAYSNMGVALKDQDKLDEAIEACKKSISLKPDYADAHHNLSFILIKNGRLKEGLDEYEWRWKTIKLLPYQRNFLQPLWDGKKSLNGKRILLWSEQGIGDTMNWSSCLSYISSQAEHCILECQDKLVPLLKRSFPNVEVKPENRSLDLKRDDFDFHLPMGSLYKHFFQEIMQNAKIDAFLVPDPVRVSFWRKRLKSIGNGPYIGICWKSSVVSPSRLHHYPPISEWSPILTIPDVTFINLQYINLTDDLNKIKNELGVTVHNFEDIDQYNNIDDVAALCAALDIVVSTKVTPPFISSAVGTSTKIANWRQSPFNSFLTNPVTSSFDMYDKNTWEPWDNVFRLIAEDISKLKNRNNNSKDKF